MILKPTTGALDVSPWSLVTPENKLIIFYLISNLCNYSIFRQFKQLRLPDLKQYAFHHVNLRNL